MTVRSANVNSSEERSRDGRTASSGGRDSSAPAVAAGDERVFDPVCGMSVDPNAQDAVRIDRNGAQYYFCSHTCRRKFESSPEEYAA